LQREKLKDGEQVGILTREAAAREGAAAFSVGRQSDAAQRYHPGSLLSVEHLGVADVAEILAEAERLEEMDWAERTQVLKGRTIALLFYESSTRTRTSFELAAKSLGATTTLVSDKSSSIEKGESLKDTGLTLRALGAEAIVLRHPASGAPELLARVTGLPVLNAGDGMHQHPTQALLDLRTILLRLRLGSQVPKSEAPVRLGHLASLRAGSGAPNLVTERTLSGVTVVITGDIRHSRVARSNTMLLPRLGAKVILCGPEELLPEEAAELLAGVDLPAGAGIEIARDFDVALARADVAMMLRIQKERLLGTALDLGEYVARYQLNEARLARHPRLLVMHPGPIIRGLEIAGEVADSARSAIEEQVAQGLAVRRAVLVRALKARATAKATA
jgi:aspartate carbamoyltransferase catalytic subunit